MNFHDKSCQSFIFEIVYKSTAQFVETRITDIFSLKHFLELK